jgi:hypothetical protein
MVFLNPMPDFEEDSLVKSASIFGWQPGETMSNNSMKAITVQKGLLVIERRIKIGGRKLANPGGKKRNKKIKSHYTLVVMAFIGFPFSAY